MLLEEKLSMEKVIVHKKKAVRKGLLVEIEIYMLLLSVIVIIFFVILLHLH